MNKYSRKPASFSSWLQRDFVTAAYSIPSSPIHVYLDPPLVFPHLRNDPNPSTHRSAIKVATQAQRLSARRSLLVKEKALTRAQAALAAERRRELPIYPITKPYQFTASDGSAVSLAELFSGRRQLLIYHFMFDPPATLPAAPAPLWQITCLSGTCRTSVRATRSSCSSAAAGSRRSTRSSSAWGGRGCSGFRRGGASSTMISMRRAMRG